jgi:Acyclic terpene utilisation family protein AtuA
VDGTVNAPSERIVRIGGASGFWGDSSVAVPQLVRRAKVDYITFDYLAELTMSILVAAKAKDPAAGWAKDFVEIALEGMLREIAERGIRLLSNAGGMNPRACATALVSAARAAGVSLRIAVVEGDDLLPAIAALRERGVSVPQQRLVSANAYLGAFPIAAALGRGAQVVITGRCVDSALPLAALIHEFGWRQGDWDRLAAGSLAGHILECGAQGSGGLHTDWEAVERWDDIGYPIAECASDGTFVVTKAPGTGGLVVPAVVSEQLLYEIGDPAAYVLPDVVCDFTNVTMRADGEHRVRVAGARGGPRPNTFKVAATYLDGYRCVGSLVIIGIDAARKARRTADAILARTRSIFAARGLADYAATNVEIIGAEHTYGPHSRASNAREVMLRLSVDHPDRRALEIFAREVAPAGTSWSPGTTGAGSGRPKPTPLVKFVSFSLPKNDVAVSVEIDGERITFAPENDVAQTTAVSPGDPSAGALESEEPAASLASNGEYVSVPLVKLAWARSGDKGDTANIGIVARRADYLPILRAQLGPERVAQYFSHLVHGKVRRYELPGIGAFNFVLEEALGGGGMASLRIDPLAKGMAQMLLDIPIALSATLATTLEATEN